MRCLFRPQVVFSSMSLYFDGNRATRAIPRIADSQHVSLFSVKSCESRRKFVCGEYQLRIECPRDFRRNHQLTMSDKGKQKGHRERLRERFISRQDDSRSDVALLELLLTYAIPQRDVRPLAEQLLTKFGGLSAVLDADLDSLCSIDGLKANTGTLIRLVAEIRKTSSAKQVDEVSNTDELNRPTLFAQNVEDSRDRDSVDGKSSEAKSSVSRRGSGLFARAVLKPAIELLPRLPNTDSITEIKDFLKKNLHFSAEQTRHRFADYIVSRMFPKGSADEALRLFAKAYQNRQELRDVCFYRFCEAEPVMYRVIDDLIRPAIGNGKRINRLERKCR
jgi:UPF0758 N-terminal